MFCLPKVEKLEEFISNKVKSKGGIQVQFKVKHFRVHKKGAEDQDTTVQNVQIDKARDKLKHRYSRKQSQFGLVFFYYFHEDSYSRGSDLSTQEKLVLFVFDQGFWPLQINSVYLSGLYQFKQSVFQPGGIIALVALTASLLLLNFESKSIK